MKRILLALCLLGSVVPVGAWWWSKDDLSSADLKQVLREVIKQQEALRDRVAYLEGSASGIFKKAFMIGKKNLSLVSHFVLDYLQYARENKASACALACGIGCGYVSLPMACMCRLSR